MLESDSSSKQFLLLNIQNNSVFSLNFMQDNLKD